MSDVQPLWRCAECKRSDRLHACAQAVVTGMLAADGELETHESSEECFVFESSIQCLECVSERMEKFVEGRWCDWEPCARCKGKGVREYGSYPVRSTPCWSHDGLGGCGGSGGRYVPVEEPDRQAV